MARSIFDCTCIEEFAIYQLSKQPQSSPIHSHHIIWVQGGAHISKWLMPNWHWLKDVVKWEAVNPTSYARFSVAADITISVDKNAAEFEVIIATWEAICD